MDIHTLITTASGKTYQLHYKIWGKDNPDTLVCVHGLTGNSQDFKFVGEYLSTRGYKVVAIDMAGRGESAYFDNPDDYNFTQYEHDLDLLLNAIGCFAPQSCDWLGVSMGGLLGFRFSGREQSPIKRLILSDVGPEVPQFDLDFIAKVIRMAPEYTSPAEAVPFLKLALGTPYSRGNLTEDLWLYFATIYLKQRADGKFIRNYDPNIAQVFEKAPLGNGHLWEDWEATHQPTLSLRGGLSTLFSVKIAEAMKARKPNEKYTITTFDDCGHVPSLFRDDQIDVVYQWLKTTST